MSSEAPGRGDNADEIIRLRDALADAEHQRDRWCADAASWERRADELSRALGNAKAGRCNTCDGFGVIVVPDVGGESASEQACPDPVHATLGQSPPRDDAGTIRHAPTGATWVTWDRRKQPPWDLIAEAVSRLTDGAVKVRAGRETEDDGGDPDRRYAAIYRELPPDVE